MKDNGFVIEEWIGVIIVTIIIIAAIVITVEATGGWGEKDASYSKTSAHCEQEEGYMGQVVVVCDAD